MNDSNAEFAMDAGEEFVHFFSGELLELVDEIDVDNRAHDQVREAVLAILTEGLLPAFEHLKRIRDSEEHTRSGLDRTQPYEDFSRDVWHAYKDLMPRAALLLGFDIGFIFQKESAFKKGVIEFRLKHPSLISPYLGEFFRRQRSAWQSDLARFRNHFLEPKADDQQKFAAFYQPANAEMLFSLAWGVMANILPVFIEANFAPGKSIEEIPIAERHPQERRRYRRISGKRAGK